MRISDWSSDVCSSDLALADADDAQRGDRAAARRSAGARPAARAAAVRHPDAPGGTRPRRRVAAPALAPGIRRPGRCRPCDLAAARRARARAVPFFAQRIVVAVLRGSPCGLLVMQALPLGTTHTPPATP